MFPARLFVWTGFGRVIKPSFLPIDLQQPGLDCVRSFYKHKKPGRWPVLSICRNAKTGMGYVRMPVFALFFRDGNVTFADFRF